MDAPLSQNIFELRYKHNLLLIDKKGFLLNILLNEFKLEQISVQENGIIVQSTDTNFSIAVFTDRIAITYKNINKIKDYENSIIKLFAILQGTDFFQKQLFVNRIGIRVRKCYEYNKTIESLKDMFLKNYMTLNPDVISKLGLELKDIAYPLTFRDKETTINTNCGPMESEQIKQFFNDFKISDLKIPKVGLYADVDYFSIPRKILEHDNLISTILNYIKQSEEKIRILRNIIMEDKI